MSDVGLVILAAGASTRMGIPKQLLRYQEQSLIRRLVEMAIASVCHPIIVVLGANAERIQPEIKPLDIQLIENHYWTAGMGTSVRVGMEALKADNLDVEAVVLMVCDQPLVSTQLINQLVDNHRATGRSIVASEYTGILGVPALFHRTLFPELTALKGDVGARQVIKQRGLEAFGIPFPEGVIDLDTPGDYEQLKLVANSSLYRDTQY